MEAAIFLKFFSQLKSFYVILPDDNITKVVKRQ